MLQQISILIAAFVGLALSWHIWRTKTQNKKLVCFIGKDCDRVVRSRFSSVLGLPNEALGLAYYGGLLALFGFGFAGIQLLPNELLLLGTGAAALFSVALIFLQLFVLKELCEWCLASTGVSIFIFVLFWL